MANKKPMSDTERRAREDVRNGKNPARVFTSPSSDTVYNAARVDEQRLLANEKLEQVRNAERAKRR